MISTESVACWVYIAELGDGRLYVGITNNPDRRVIDHELGDSSRTTLIFGFRKFLYKEPHPDLASARRREVQLKKWTRAKKLALIAGDKVLLKGLARSRQGRR